MAYLIENKKPKAKPLTVDNCHVGGAFREGTDVWIVVEAEHKGEVPCWSPEHEDMKRFAPGDHVEEVFAPNRVAVLLGYGEAEVEAALAGRPVVSVPISSPQIDSKPPEAPAPRHGTVEKPRSVKLPLRVEHDPDCSMYGVRCADGWLLSYHISREMAEVFASALTAAWTPYEPGDAELVAFLEMWCCHDSKADTLYNLLPSLRPTSRLSPDLRAECLAYYRAKGGWPKKGVGA